MEKIEIYDTTLRDGEQQEGVKFIDRIKVLQELDRFGVDYVEFGQPSANEAILNEFRRALTFPLKNSKVVAFGPTCKKGLSPSEDKGLLSIVESGSKIATIYGKTWLDHVEKQLKVTPKENLDLINKSISFLREKNIDVFYDAEHFFDGYKDNREYALETLKVARDAGAIRIILCDTNGGTLPSELRGILLEVRKTFPDMKLGIHAHNDSGVAIANTLEAVSLGVVQVQGTINETGERTGNTDLCIIIPNLILKMKLSLNPAIDTRNLCNLRNKINELGNLNPNKKQPFVGENAFRHEAGAHVDAIEKGASYEHVDPSLVGNIRFIGISELSGRANVVDLLRRYNIQVDKTDPRILNLLSVIKEMESRGYDISSLPAEQELLVNKYFFNVKSDFDITYWNISSEKKENEENSKCILIGLVDKKEKQVVSYLNGGPVNAAYESLKKFLSPNYNLEDVSLIDFHVRIAKSIGEASTVRVFVEFKNGQDIWATVGVSENILEASLEAVKKGFEYYLEKHIKDKLNKIN